MPVTYASPGVYVEVVDRGTKPVEAVGTSVAAFVGITAEASEKVTDPITGARRPILPAALLNQAILVTNWRQYTEYFGEFIDGAYLPDAVYGYFANGGGPCYIVSLRALKELAEKDIPYAGGEVPAASGRGKSLTLRARRPGPSGNAIVATVKNDPEVEGAPATFSLTIDGEMRSGLSMKKGENGVADAVYGAVDILDVGTSPPAEGDYPLTGGGIQPLTTVDFVGDPTERTGLGGLEALDDVRLVLCPDIMAGYEDSPEARERVKATQAAIIAHCERLRYRFAILDTPPGLNAQEAAEWRRYVAFDSSYAALYYPWIRVADLSGASRSKLVPPSGHVVGIYNRTDADRGVHKAPANEVVQLAIDVETNLSKGEQDTLNPIGVNCIRSFPMRGIRVWGARTLSSDPPGATSTSAACSSWSKRAIQNAARSGWSSSRTTPPCGPRCAAMSRRLPARGLAQRRALRHYARRGLLCQVRRGVEPQRDPRSGPVDHRDWPGPGQAGRVRHLPHQPVGRAECGVVTSSPVGQ